VDIEVIGRRKSVCYVGRIEEMAVSQPQTREEGVVLVLSLGNLKNLLVFRAPLIAVCSDRHYCGFFLFLVSYFSKLKVN
jgi:hypothetical protein